jgi:predicted DNA-binding helix-hairpin-helix protein
VGATNEPDSEIIATIDRFMDNYGLRRPFFMSFDPVADTPLSGNKASPLWPHSELLRVPGIGPRTANRIVRGRLVFDYKQLAVMGVVLKRGRQFIIVAGHRQADLEAFS